MRIRIKDEHINLENTRIETKCSDYAVKIQKATQELKVLEAQLEEEVKNKKIRDLKPMLAQKFLGDAFHKMKE